MSQVEVRIFWLLCLMIMIFQAPFIIAVPGTHWDDAYIFFRFAENIGSGNGWSFNPGQTSGGATSVLWTTFLVPLYWISGDQLPSIAKFAGATLNAMAAGVWALLLTRFTERAWIGVIGGLFIALNPTNLLLAVSGMETPLLILLLAIATLSFQRSRFNLDWRVGIYSGLLTLIRPEAGVAFLLACSGSYLAILMARKDKQEFRSHAVTFLIKGGWVLAATTAVVVPYLIFNFYTSGHLLPQTGTGKLFGRLPQFHGISYAEFREMGILLRLPLAVQNLFDLFGFTKGGVSVAPSAIILIIVAPIFLMSRKFGETLRIVRPPLILFWIYSVALLFALCFLFPIPIPRYMAPLVPVTIVGSILLISKLGLPHFEKILEKLRVNFRITFLIVCVAILMLSLSIYGFVYYRYTHHIQSSQEIQKIAHWLRHNTEESATIALEPIGQVGYYAERRIVDLGGLIDNDIWNCLRRGYGSDPGCIIDYFDSTSVDYFVDRPPDSPLSFHAVVEYNTERFDYIKSFSRGDYILYRFKKKEM